MPRFRFAAALALLSGLMLVSGGAAAPGVAPPLPAGWSHAEINVTIKGVAHTLIYDRGRVIAVAVGSLTLKERDGIVVTIAVAPDAIVTLNKRRVALTDLRVGATALALRVDGGAAKRVEAVGRLGRGPQAKPPTAGKRKDAAEKAAKLLKAGGR
jgi:hypothetical protein